MSLLEGQNDPIEASERSMSYVVAIMFSGYNSDKGMFEFQDITINCFIEH